MVDALSTQDHDSKTLMLGDVVVVGGSAGFEGLGMRLEKDLKKLLPKWLGDRVKVRVPSADGLQHRCAKCSLEFFFFPRVLWCCVCVFRGLILVLLLVVVVVVVFFVCCPSGSVTG